MVTLIPMVTRIHMVSRIHMVAFIHMTHRIQVHFIGTAATRLATIRTCRLARAGGCRWYRTTDPTPGRRTMQPAHAGERLTFLA
jgi:hypothetical protein